MAEGPQGLYQLGSKEWSSGAHLEVSQNEIQASELEIKPRGRQLTQPFSQLVKVTKLTGCGVCPPHVAQAKEIDKLINEEAGMWDLSDSDIANEDCTISISSDEEPTPEVKAWVVWINEKNSSKNSCTHHGLDIMDKLTNALDPAHQQARDDTHAWCGFEQAHYMALAQQLCNSQGTIELLCNTIIKIQARLQASESCRKWAELCLEMLEMTVGTCCIPQLHMPALPLHSWNKVWMKQKHEEWYLDGRGCITWITNTNIEGSDQDSPALSKPSDLPPLSAETLPSPYSAFTCIAVALEGEPGAVALEGKGESKTD